MQNNLQNLRLVRGVGVEKEEVATCSPGISLLKAKATFLPQAFSRGQKAAHASLTSSGKAPSLAKSET